MADSMFVYIFVIKFFKLVAPPIFNFPQVAITDLAYTARSVLEFGSEAKSYLFAK